MNEKQVRRLKRFAVSAAVAATATVLAAMFLPPLATVSVAAAGFLGVAAASDDDLGSCLVFAILAVFCLILLAMVLVAVIKVNEGKFG